MRLNSPDHPVLRVDRRAAGARPDPVRVPSPTLERLRFIKLAQSLGLSLADIREILAFRDRGEAPSS